MGYQSPQFTYALGALRARLGVEARHKDAWAIRYIQALVDEHGFPAPIPAMIGERLTNKVVARSKWRIEPVDQWFEDQMPDRTPPGGLAAMRDGQRDMDEAAQLVAAGIGRRSKFGPIVVDGGRR